MHTCTQSVICKVDEPQSICLHNSVQQNFTQTISHDIVVLNVCFEDTGLSVSVLQIDNFGDSQWEQSHHHSRVTIPFHQLLKHFHYCLPPM